MQREKKKKKPKRHLSFPVPREFQTPISSSRTPDPSLLLGDPRLLISLPGNWLCQYSHLLMNFPQFVVIHTVKSFSGVNEADVFLELSCFFDDPVDVGNLISGFSKSSLNIWKFLVHILLKPGLKDFMHSLASIGNEFNYMIILDLKMSFSL